VGVIMRARQRKRGGGGKRIEGVSYPMAGVGTEHAKSRLMPLRFPLAWSLALY
jgi:hypothetical protein